MPLSLRAIILLFTSIAVLPAASVAHQQAPTFSVGGGIDVKVPTPDGFQQIDQSSERVRDLAQVGVRPDGRLLAVYMSNDDAARLTRGEAVRPQQWLLLQTFRLAESMDFDDERFKGVAATIEEGTPQIADAAKNYLSELTEQFSRSASSAALAVKLRTDGPVSMGLYDRQAHVLSWGLLVPFRVTAGEHSDNFVIAGATSVVHVSGKLLFTYVYRMVNSPSDIDWVRSTATAWVAAILGANPPAASPGDTTPRPAPAAPIRVSGEVVPPGTSTPPYRPGAVGLTLPLVLLKVDPAYTPAALRERIGGTVVLDCVVREDGKVGECRVTRSLDSRFGLDQEAIKAARQWLFVPGKKNEIPFRPGHHRTHLLAQGQVTCGVTK